MAYGRPDKYPVNDVIDLDQDMPVPVVSEAIRTCLKNAPSAQPETTRETIMTDTAGMLDLLHRINGNVDEIKVDVGLLKGGFSQLQVDVSQLRRVIDRLSEESAAHTRILAGHTHILEGHTRILEEHSRTLEEHSRTLEEHGRAIRKVQEDISIMRSVLDSHSHLLHKHDAALQSYIGSVNIVLQDTRLLRTTLNRLEKTEGFTLSGVKVFPEDLVKVFNDDLNRLQHQVSDLMARVEKVEALH